MLKVSIETKRLVTKFFVSVVVQLEGTPKLRHLF
jgi:hypothetical protein